MTVLVRFHYTLKNSVTQCGTHIETEVRFIVKITYHKRNVESE